MMECVLESKVSSKFTGHILNDILLNETNLKNIEVTNIEFGSDQKRGDSYLSTVTRFTVNGFGTDERTNERKTFSIPIITKALITNICRRKTFRSTDFFRNESNFFNKVWHTLLTFQKSKKLEKPFLNIPRCFFAYSDGENDFIALEDLSYQNYATPMRQEGLDLNHTKLILQCFSQFHALSLALKDQQPGKFREMRGYVEETYFLEKLRSYYSKFQGTLFEVVKDAVKKHLPQKYLQKFEAMISTDFFGDMVKMCKIDGPLSVITHGDAWMPNFLMKYNSEKIPVSAMMIDFQLARYTSLSLDITFFLYSCTGKALRDNHWDELIHFYHQELTEMLYNLGSSKDLLTLEDLKADIKKNAKFGVGMTIEALPMSLLDDSEISDLESLQGNEAVPIETVWIVRPFKSVEKTKRIAEFIQDVVDREFI